jgi:hypothetical protein
MSSFLVPIVLIVFNRVDLAQRVFNIVKEKKPKKLYIIADGARSEIEGEELKCVQTRAIFDEIDWPCEITKIYANENLGCGKRIYSGLTEVFKHEQRAIILEDDCVASHFFFQFCDELLDQYADDSRIGMISGNNFIEEECIYPESYHFSQFTHIWGWATWRRAWLQYDFNMTGWEEKKAQNWLGSIFKDDRDVKSWERRFNKAAQGKSWGYQFVYTSIIQNWLCVMPRKNLVKNIGFGKDATHTHVANPSFQVNESLLTFPLIHPTRFVINKELDEKTQKKVFRDTKKPILKKLMRSIQKRFKL